MKKVFSLISVCMVYIGLSFGYAAEIDANTTDLLGRSAWPVVKTGYGPVKGVKEEGITVFRGIPFAKPPVGELRFAPPEEPEPWSETLDCSKFRDVPVQENNTAPFKQSEDCLYLNIWTPENAKGKNLPVFVFIHGGGYSFGFSSKNLYSGKRFAQDGIIQVNISYRLNAMGFLPTAEGEARYGYLGNIGTLDQIKALQWIKNNIHVFGGDAGNITICGESAGAFSVSNMILSPMAKGLFNRAIMQSGNTLGQPLMMAEMQGYREQSLERGDRFAASLNALNSAGKASLEKLRKLSARSLSEASYLSMDFTRPSPFYFFTVFDGVVIPENPYQALMDGKTNDVPILVGFNTDEGTLFIPGSRSETAYREILEKTFGKKRAKEVYERYPVNEKNNATQRARDLIKMALRIGGDIFADVLSSRGQKVYSYQFDYKIPELIQKDLGVMHALELPFVFDTMPENLTLDEEGLAFKEVVHRYWLNFIRTGNPNIGDEVPAEWPPYTDADKKILVLDKICHEKKAPDTEDVAFFRKLIWEEMTP